jgi:hypothetical protein
MIRLNQQGRLSPGQGLAAQRVINGGRTVR